MTRLPELPGHTTTITAMGVNVTLVRDGESAAFHFPGSTAMRDLAAFCDRYGYTVACISTPRTIYRDLQGTREALADLTAGNPHEKHRSGQLNTPEAAALSRIGRKDLLT